VKNLVRTQGERQPIKKKQNVSEFEISEFFCKIYLQEG
jgi:hypothetical protein